MPKRLIGKFLPSPAKLKNSALAHILGEQIHNPNLWHLNRRSAAGAAFIGFFCAFLPIPFQMGLAALLALWFHKNLPLSIALVWLSNPFTYAPMFYFNYRLGSLILGESENTFSFEMSWEWLANDFFLYSGPLALGSVIAGLSAGTIGYFIISSYWRWKVVQRWEKRQKNQR